MSQKIFRSTLLLVIFSMISLLGYCPPKGPGGPACFPPSKCIPVDGGVGVLIAAGLLYGSTRIKKQIRK